MQSQDNDKTLVGGFTLDLVYSIVSEDGKKHLLEGGEIIGRGKDCDIFIDDKKISRNHAEFNIKNGRLHLKDLGSSNGTYKNGEKLKEEVALSNGDNISFEKHVYTVKVEMAQEDKPQEVEAEEENSDDFTAVVDMSDEYLEKLSKAAEMKKPTPEAKEKAVPNIEKSEEKPQPKHAEIPSDVKDENIPKSWVEDAGAVDGTRMMGVGELDALRAGMNTVANNDTDTARLHCFIEAQDEEIIELNISDYQQATGWEIGRDSSCDIVIDHPSVSNRHAQIIHQNGRWKMVNLVSTNGIMINGQKKLTSYLTDGDKIGLGTVTLVFKAAKSAAKHKKSKAMSTSSNKKSPMIPVLMVLILLVLAALIYLYIN